MVVQYAGSKNSKNILKFEFLEIDYSSGIVVLLYRGLKALLNF